MMAAEKGINSLSSFPQEPFGGKPADVSGDSIMKTIPAVYENGIFRPQEPVELPAGAHVQVMLPDSDPLADIRARFNRVIGAIPLQDIDRMEADIEEAFGKVDADAWK